MPNRAVHDTAGVAPGGLLAVLMAGEQPNAYMFLECLGGGIGGFAASRLPDKFDPPVCPNHRDIAHAVLPVGGAVVAIWEVVKQGQEALRSYADQLAVQRTASNNMSDFERLLNQLLEWACRVLAGVLAGAVGGYVSHLALDAGSTRGLPLLANGS